MHVIVAFAAPSAASWSAAEAGLRALAPAALRALDDWQPQAAQALAPHDAAWPHERALARALGWPDEGDLPMAAWSQGRGGQAMAWLSPCHWQLGMDQAWLGSPEDAALHPDEAHALCADLAAHLAHDGLSLQPDGPGRWRSEGALWQGWSSPSPERMAGQSVRDWVGPARWPAAWRRLHSELQLLLDQHPLNEARALRGLPLINAVWPHGVGVLPAPSDQVRLETRLLAPALAGDLPAWLAQWPALLQEWARMPDLQTLSLCGAQGVQVWQRQPPAWPARLWRRWQTPALLQAWQTLSKEHP